MSIRTILVPIPADEPHDSVVEAAAQAAKITDAHMVGLLLHTNGQAPVPRAVGSYAASATQAAEIARITEQRMRDDERRHDELRMHFAELCKIHGVSFDDDDEEPDPDHLPSASWRLTEGDVRSVATTQAPAYDLTIAASGAVGRREREIAERSLLESGRPVLLSPMRLDRDMGRTVAIAWDPSPQCWRAVTAALPFLMRADNVIVLSVGDSGDRKAKAESQEEVLRYLAWHGIGAEARTLDRGVRRVPETILTDVEESHAGLLVMGAYSHSPFREAMFGGVTRAVLEASSVTPVLMAH